MHPSIAQKFWLPLILISGIATVNLGQGWSIDRSPAPESDYRQSLRLLFNTTNSTLRSLEYVPHQSSAQARNRSTR
jgi:hypothetical protein